MPSRFLLIDGYNLLHAAGMARAEYGPGDLQRCRERLLRFLASKLSRAEISRTTVIFDARDPPPDRPAQQQFRGITVLFANPGGDADVVIQDWLDAHTSPKRVTLVSSDHALQRAARRNRAQSIDSERFFADLEKRLGHAPDESRARASDESKPRAELSSDEAAHWMQLFGDLSDVLQEPAEPSAPEKTPTDSGHPSEKPARGASPTGKSRRRRSPQESGGRKPIRKAKEDLDYWLEVFGKLPEAGELRKGRGISQEDLEKWLSEWETDPD